MGFQLATKTGITRKVFAKNMAKMIQATRANGVDIDWEYPEGNKENYRKVSNETELWEIEAFPKLLYKLQSALGPDVILSIAVPGKPGDMFAFTQETTPRINEFVDFVNVMTYDLMNSEQARYCNNSPRGHKGCSYQHQILSRSRFPSRNAKPWARLLSQTVQYGP